MNKIVNNLLLEEEKFMSEMHLNIFRMELSGVAHKWMGGEGVEGGRGGQKGTTSLRFVNHIPQ